MLGLMMEPEPTDEDLADDDDGNLLAVIELPVWSRLRAAGVKHAVLVAAENNLSATTADALRSVAHRGPG